MKCYINSNDILPFLHRKITLIPCESLDILQMYTLMSLGLICLNATLGFVQSRYIQTLQASLGIMKHLDIVPASGFFLLAHQMLFDLSRKPNIQSDQYDFGTLTSINRALLLPTNVYVCVQQLSSILVYRHQVSLIQFHCLTNTIKILQRCILHHNQISAL